MAFSGDLDWKRLKLQILTRTQAHANTHTSTFGKQTFCSCRIPNLIKTLTHTLFILFVHIHIFYQTDEEISTHTHTPYPHSKHYTDIPIQTENELQQRYGTRIFFHSCSFVYFISFLSRSVCYSAWFYYCERMSEHVRVCVCVLCV